MIGRLICVLLIATAAGSTQSVSYVYDASNRLSGVAYADGTTIKYSYDASGNRISQIVSNPSIALPTVQISRTDLQFSAVAGQVATTQSVMVSNAGGGSLQWNAFPSAPWLSATPGSGTDAGRVSVAASAVGLPAGIYSGSITI